MQLTLKNKRPQTGDITSYVFTPVSPMEWRAGQFLTYTLPHDQPDDEGEKRLFTIAAAPHEQNPVITTRVSDSSFKQALDAMQPGDTIEASDPEGDFEWQESERPLVLVAGGIGMTPFYAMLKDRARLGKPLKATLVYANRSEDTLYRSELDAWQGEHPELHIHYLVGERLTDERLRQLVPGLGDSLVYVSGPEPMVEALGDELRENSLAEAQLKQDFFPGYSELNY